MRDTYDKTEFRSSRIFLWRGIDGVAGALLAACDEINREMVAPTLLPELNPLAISGRYQGTFFNFCTRKSENTLTLGARCLLLL
jgi:hypothetical protein